MKVERVTGFALLQALSGLGVWALCFVVLYGGLSIGCHSGWALRTAGPFNALSVGLIAAWAIHAAVLGFMLVRAWRRVRGVDARPSPRVAHAGAGKHDGTPPPFAHGPGGKGAFVIWLTLVLHGMSAVALMALAAPLFVLAPCV